MNPPPDFRAIGAAFGFSGLFSAAAHGSGHIHDSFLARYARGPAGGEVLLQRFNERVFPDPGRVMENVLRVTEHLRAQLGGEPDAERRALTVLPAASGGVTWRDAQDRLWRAFVFIAGAHSREGAAQAGDARLAAFAFARFQRALADLPAPRLHETLADFHHTPKRLAALAAAVVADPCGRAAGAAPEIDFALGHQPLAGLLHQAWEAATAAGRVTHNDTKLNNVLFDDRTGEALCVVDLDTVMPGLPLHDFGDLARFALLPAEDERDLARVAVSLPLFEELARGWILGMGPAWERAELGLLPTAARVMTLECGMRFLTDFLAGDVYFKTGRPAQNLDRARAHFQLVRRLEETEPELLRRCAAIG